jgi:dihydroorotate dehydrogenase (fumarate)
MRIPPIVVHRPFTMQPPLGQLILDKSTVLLTPVIASVLRRAITALFVALMLATGLVAASAALPARADDTNGISGTPADENGADGRSRFDYQVEPGQRIDDAYLLRNTGTTPQVMKLYATDAYNTEDGSYGLLETGLAPSDAGSWVSFGGASTVDVPLEPGATQTVPFTLVVPADAAPGDHAAGIVISTMSAQGQVMVDRRVATRLYLRVPGDLQPALTISSIAAEYSGEFNPLDGQTSISFTVKNSGNVALAATMVAGVNTYLGIGTGEKVRQDLSEMLPGSTRTITMVVPGVPQLGYLNPYVSLAPSVDEEALNPGPLPTVTRDTVAFAMPWLLLALLAIAAVVVLFLRIRRARDEKTARDWIAYTEAEARRKARAESQDLESSEQR